MPAFSPDGQSLVFSNPDGVQRVSVAGGALQRLAPQTGGGTSVPTWASDGTILFANAGGLFRVPDAGGDVETLASVDPSKGKSAFHMPELLPGGEAILFGVLFTDDREQGAVLDLKTGNRRALPGSHRLGQVRPFRIGGGSPATCSFWRARP